MLQLTLSLLLVMITSVMKTILLGFGLYYFDFITDVILGLQYYYPKNVTRYLPSLINSTMIPEICVPHLDVNTTGMFECEEEHKDLAYQTFANIFWPQLVIAFEHGRKTVMYGCTHGFDANVKKALMPFFYYLLVPLPIIVFVHHVRSLFIMNEFTETRSTFFLALGASFEDGPQLITQLCIMLSA